MNGILDAALAYAARGWPVFPCRAADSPELKDSGKPKWEAKAPLIKDGLNAASADADQVRRWWKRWPDALIGLPLGGPTGIFALDFDPREVVDPETGEVERFELAQLKADTEAMIGCALPATVAQMTPSRGVHVFFRQPDGSTLPEAANSGRGEITNKGCLPLHVDVRGKGGYVIVPPSVVLTNHKGATGPYRWLRGELLIDEPAEAPAMLIAVLRAPKGSRVVDGVLVGPESAAAAAPERTARRAASDEIEEGRRRYGINLLSRLTADMAAAREGSRGETLNRVAFALGGAVGAAVLSRAVAAHELAAAADRAGLTAKDGAEAVRATIERSLAAGEARPLDLADVDRDTAEWNARRAGGSRGRSAAARTSAPAPAASSSGSAGPCDPPPPPAPSGWSDDSRPSHMGRERKRGRLWGPAGEDGKPAWDWQWARELADLAVMLKCIPRPLTDLGNAERFAARHGWRFRYTEMRGWFCWDGKRWVREGAEAALLKAAQDTVRGIQWEARFIADSGLRVPDEVRLNRDGELSAAGIAIALEGRLRVEEMEGEPPGLDEFIEYKNGRTRCRSDRHASWGRASEAAGKIAAIPQLVKGLAGITVKTDVFDQQPMVLNVLNGALHFLRTEDGPRIVKRRHDPDLLLTKVAPVEYRPKAESPLYDKFLGRVQPDPEVRRFLHAWAGYNLTGDVGQQCFVILHGAKGANGKSTWENLRGDILGDYSLSVKIETFLNSDKKGSGTEASPDIARLPGARHVRTSEPGQQAAFAEDLIKVVTGSERMVARLLHKDFFEFDPQFKITVQCNREPKASDDNAFWRRVKKVPFDVSIPEDERIDADVFRAMLRQEASGVLNHFLAGALDWMAGGLPTVDRIVQATAAYRERSDTLGSFLRAATRPEDGATVGSHELYEVYCAWCVFAGEKAWTQKGFSNALNGAGFEKIKASSMKWQGMRLVRQAGAFVTREFVGDGKHIERPREEMGPEIEGLEPVAAEREGETPNPPAGAPPAPPLPETAGEWANGWDE